MGQLEDGKPVNNLKLKVIYEDNHLLVVEKPVNLPVQADASGDLDMLTLLKADLKERYQKPGEVYLGLVHRLDRPAGGVMVFAKTSKAAARLSEQVRERELEKIYYAVVRGEILKAQARLEDYLYKENATNTVKVVSANAPGAKEAVLEYQLVSFQAGLSLVQIKLHTGRAHQIRVQFAHLGHPLYGDQRYGAGLNHPGEQLALWATSLTLKHPTKQEQMTFVSEPPQLKPWNVFQYI